MVTPHYGGSRIGTWADPLAGLLPASNNLNFGVDLV
jgi:hypothetical protein